MALNFATNNSLSSITALPASISGGGLNLISTQTASNSSTISFTSGLDSSYKEYIFKFYNIHPDGGTGRHFSFQGSTDGGSSYGVNITSTFFQADHNEADTTQNLTYEGGKDLAQSTSFQRVLSSITANADDSGSGTFHLFDPSNTTFVKHFIAAGNLVANAYVNTNYVAGYLNTTSAIDAIQFKFDSGNIESGVIKLYGVS
nr:hypothetical protein [uncultured Mediterranean phage uvMED]